MYTRLILTVTALLICGGIFDVRATHAQAQPGYQITLSIDTLMSLGIQEDRLWSDGDEIYVIYGLYPVDQEGEIMTPVIQSAGPFKYQLGDIQNQAAFDPVTLQLTPDNGGFVVTITVWEQDQEQSFTELAAELKDMSQAINKSSSAQTLDIGSAFLGIPDPVTMIQSASYLADFSTYIFGDDAIGKGITIVYTSRDMADLTEDGLYTTDASGSFIQNGMLAKTDYLMSYSLSIEPNTQTGSQSLRSTAAEGDLTTINTLLDEAQIALNERDLPTAQALLTSVDTLLDDTLTENCEALITAKVLLEQAASARGVANAQAFLTGAQALIESCDS